MTMGNLPWEKGAKLLRKKTPVCEKHGHQICPVCDPVTDAAKRMCDLINLHLLANSPVEIRFKWMAFRLSDGGSDNVLYDTREDAIRHQLDERYCCYFTFMDCLGGATPLDCQIFLNMHRTAYDGGMRLHEPEAPQLINSVHGYDVQRDVIRRSSRGR
jgi:hypothetical protein